MPIFFDDPEFDGQFLRALDGIWYGGADVGECFSTARRIVDGDQESWYAEWLATAERVHAIAEQSAAAGHRISAAEAYLRAVTYFRSAGIFMYRAPLDPRFVAVNARLREAFGKAAALLDQGIEPIAIPYEATTLPGYFVAADANGHARPTLILNTGYDGPCEEYWFSGAQAALKRGYNVLFFDGPGQGAALVEQGLVFRYDWEAVITPVVDELVTRSEVDPDRIALMGRSWGGYLAPRAATAEHRLAALIADAAQYNPAQSRLALLPEELRPEADTGDPALLNAAIEEIMDQHSFVAFAVHRGMLTHGVDSPIAYIRSMRDFTLEGLADRITCATLICEAENDVRGGDAKPLYDALTAPKTYILFTNEEGAGEHDEAGAASLFAQRVFDWLDETLASVRG